MEQRYPFKLIRGQIARREGFVATHIDPATGQPTRRKSQPFTFYQARSGDNPLARDEIMLTEREAQAHNSHGRRLVRLLSGGVKTAPDDMQTLEGLLNLMVNTRGAPAVASARQAIFDSGLLPEVKLPYKKAELVSVLQKAISDKNTDAGATAGPGSSGGNEGAARLRGAGVGVRGGGGGIVEADRPE